MKWYRTHVASCKRDNISNGLKIRAALIAKASLSKASSRKRVSSRALEGLSLLDASFQRPDVKRGWGLRPKRGHRYGKSYVELYKVELQEMFDNGRKNKGLKINAAMMLARLKENCPNRFAIPSEETIKSFISAAFARQKDGEQKQYDSNNPTDGVAVVKRSGIGSTYAAALHEIGEESNWAAKPAAAVTALKQKFASVDGLPEGFPTDTQIKNRYNSRKVKRSRMA